MTLKNRLFALFLFFLGCKLFASQVKEELFYSEALKRNWRFSVYLPDGYSKNQPYPIIYLLHGMFNDNTAFFNHGLGSILDQAIAQKELPPAIVVCPNGYGFSWWLDSKNYGAIEKAFFQDLMPYAEKRFNAGGSKSKRIIGGISMGGYGSLRYALLHPELFSKALLFSPAVFWPVPGQEAGNRKAHPPNIMHYNTVLGHIYERGVFGSPFNAKQYIGKNYRALWPGYIKANSPLDFFIFYGSQDPITDIATQNLIDFLTQENQRLYTQSIHGGHEWSVWLEAFRSALKQKIFA